MQVLTETDHCYCVLLNAHDGAAFPSEKESPDNSSSGNTPLNVDSNSGKTKNSKVWVTSQFTCENYLFWFHDLPYLYLLSYI